MSKINDTSLRSLELFTVPIYSVILSPVPSLLMAAVKYYFPEKDTKSLVLMGVLPPKLLGRQGCFCCTPRRTNCWEWWYTLHLQIPLGVAGINSWVISALRTFRS